MFAAMRLPAARRFAATILRATITGSVNFISTPLFATLAMGRSYRTSDLRTVSMPALDLGPGNRPSLHVEVKLQRWVSKLQGIYLRSVQ